MRQIFIFSILILMQFTASAQDICGKVKDASCGSKGSIILEINGGVAPYEFNWEKTNDPSYSNTTQDALNLSSGNYIVNITDALCGKLSLGFTIIDATLSVNHQVFQSCDETGGTVKLAVNFNGSETISYTWKDENGTVISTNKDVSKLAKGKYCYTVQAGECEASDCVDIKEFKTPLSITGTSIAIVQPDKGSVTFNISGGTIPYSWTIYGPTAFKLPGIGSPATASDLTEGDYKIIVFDDNGCGSELTRKVISCDNFNIEKDLEITSTIQNCPFSISFDYPAKGVRGLKETYIIPQDIKLIHPKTGEEYITREESYYCLELSPTPDGGICGSDFEPIRKCYSPQCGTVEFDSDLSSCDEEGELYVTTNGLCEPITYIWSNSTENKSMAPVNPLKDKFVNVAVIDRNGCKYEHTYNFDIVESGNLSGGCGESVVASVRKNACNNTINNCCVKSSAR